MFEHHQEPLLPKALFFWRVFSFALMSLGLAAFSLLPGILGYRLCEGLSWIEAFVNAPMILGGMGPVSELHTDSGKLCLGNVSLDCRNGIGGAHGVVSTGF
jgi:hypothetical protein